VPADCVAANTADETEYSLPQMKNILKADIRESAEIDLEALKNHGKVACATSLRDDFKFQSRPISKPANRKISGS
jgi:hypothetical protein